jgi:hydroxyacyl-ACP dehydratase HTD2-like protein with hotdog domain
VAPAFSGAPLNLHADTLDNGTMALWTSQGEGVVAMQATAAWR